MPYHFRRKDTVQKGLRRIAREQIDRAIAEIDDTELDRHETVHQVRKRCKKIRGLLRLVRPEMEEIYQEENARFRDASRELSYVRDAQSIIETYDKLMDRFADQVERSQFARIRRKLTARRKKIADDEVGLDEHLQTFRDRMAAARRRLNGWKIDDNGFAALAGGLRKTYARGRKAMRAAYDSPSVETFHEWRKRVKYLWYHVRLLRSMWQEMMDPHCAVLDELSGLLGDEHDLAVFRQLLLDEPDVFGEPNDLQALLGLIDHRRLELQTAARSLGEKLYAEKPKWLAKRFGRYWQSWKMEPKRRISGKPGTTHVAHS